MILPTTPPRLPPADPQFPETDGRPMGENTLRLKWIVTLYLGFYALFRDRPDVFVAGDLFWYPDRRDNTIVQAPDVMVMFGRPPHERRTYRQWEEDDVAPQAVFEVLSPTNTRAEMRRKLQFYQRHGVQEYYVYDPDDPALEVWVRSGRRLLPGDPAGFTSPRLGVGFELLPGEPLRVVRPDGEPFPFVDELAARVATEHDQLAAARRRADRAERRAKRAEKRAAELAEKLRQLGGDPDAR